MNIVIRLRETIRNRNYAGTATLALTDGRKKVFTFTLINLIMPELIIFEGEDELISCIFTFDVTDGQIQILSKECVPTPNNLHALDFINFMCENIITALCVSGSKIHEKEMQVTLVEEDTRLTSSIMTFI